MQERTASNRADHSAVRGSAPGVGLSPAMVAVSVGTLGAREPAAATHAGLPAPLLDAARAAAPVACLYALLISVEPMAARAAAVAAIAAHDGEAAVRQVQAWLPTCAGIAIAARLPLLNLALPALQDLEANVRLRVRRTIAALVAGDGEISSFEFAAARILDDHLSDDAARAVPVRYFSFAAVAGSLRVVLTALAWAGARDAALAQAAYQRAYLPFSLGAASLPARQAGRIGPDTGPD